MSAVLGVLLVLSVSSLTFPAIGVPYVMVLVGGGAALARARGRGGLGGWLVELDRVLFEGEKALVSTALVVMSVVVFLDVLWRTVHEWDVGSTWTAAGFALAVALLGAFTARWPNATALRRLSAGLAAFAVTVIGTWLVAQVEGGFGWSQRLALVLVVWVGLLGGSMASYLGRHIAVDAAKRLVPVRFARAMEIVTSVVTSATCAFLALVGARYGRGNFDDWVDSEFSAYVFESIPIPYWVASAAIPIGFALMSARFLGVAFGYRPARGSDPHGLPHQPQGTSEARA